MYPPPDNSQPLFCFPLNNSNKRIYARTHRHTNIFAVVYMHKHIRVTQSFTRVVRLGRVHCVVVGEQVVYSSNRYEGVENLERVRCWSCSRSGGEYGQEWQHTNRNFPIGVIISLSASVLIYSLICDRIIPFYIRIE